MAAVHLPCQEVICQRDLPAKKSVPLTFLLDTENLDTENTALITPTHPVLADPNLGGLLYDYLRLIRYQHVANPLKLLVLMLDNAASRRL